MTKRKNTLPRRVKDMVAAGASEDKHILTLCNYKMKKACKVYHFKDRSSPLCIYFSW